MSRSFESRFCYVNATHGLIICELDAASGQFAQKMILSGHHHTVRALLYHPTKNILVSSGVEGVFVWNLETGICEKEIKFGFFLCFTLSETTDSSANEGEVICLCWLYDGSILATGGRDSTVRMWDVENEYPSSNLFTVVSTSSKPSQLTRAASIRWCSARSTIIWSLLAATARSICGTRSLCPPRT